MSLPRPVPRLEREVDLGPRWLRLSDWPGQHGPLVCLPDPLGSRPSPAPMLADALAPEWRVIEASPSSSLPYQAQAADTLALLDTFGFQASVLLGHGPSGAVALLVAAWYPARLAGLVLVDGGGRLARTARQRLAMAAEKTGQPAWRGLLDAPPDWATLQRQVACPTLAIRTSSRPALLARDAWLAFPATWTRQSAPGPRVPTLVEGFLRATRAYNPARGVDRARPRAAAPAGRPGRLRR